MTTRSEYLSGNIKTVPIQVNLSDWPSMEEAKIKSGLTWPAILKLGLRAAKKGEQNQITIA